jgi:predicted CXXCH cytochrome family protein
MDQAMKKTTIITIFLSIIIVAVHVIKAENKPTGYAGSNSCQPCHEEQYNSWKSSKHASQFKPDERDTQACNACHATAAGVPTQALLENNVGCEACHGPGEAHISGGGDKTKIVSDKSADICGRCHNGNRNDTAEWAAEYKPGMKLADIKELKLILVAPDKLAPSLMNIHPSLTYNMWLVSGHAKTPERTIVINGKKWDGPITCAACHNPHSSNNKAQLVMDSKELCKSCHMQSAVLKGFGAKGIEETRSLHTAAACVACHMTEKSHLMKMFRPDDPDLTEDRLDSCSDCHEIKDRKMRAAQLKDMESWYREAFEPVQADLKMIDEKLKGNPEILNAELKTKLNDVKSNLSININDGSNGVHNLDYALEIMSQAKKQLKEIKQALQ